MATNRLFSDLPLQSCSFVAPLAASRGTAKRGGGSLNVVFRAAIPLYLPVFRRISSFPQSP